MRAILSWKTTAQVSVRGGGADKTDLLVHSVWFEICMQILGATQCVIHSQSVSLLGLHSSKQEALCLSSVQIFCWLSPLCDSPTVGISI